MQPITMQNAIFCIITAQPQSLRSTAAPFFLLYRPKKMDDTKRAMKHFSFVTYLCHLLNLDAGSYWAHRILINFRSSLWQIPYMLYICKTSGCFFFVIFKSKSFPNIRCYFIKQFTCGNECIPCTVVIT